jgi:hypothetical protein
VGLATVGLLLSLAVVVSWGRLGPEPGSRNPTSWLGLLAVVAPHDASKAGFLFILVPALVLLLFAWWQLQRLAAGQRLATRSAAFIAACWALPFAAGPIIASRDAYAYVAQGDLALRGLDPAHSVVSQLGPGALLDAVDPRWRDTRPPYGGVAVALQKVAASGDQHPAVSLLILRVMALCAVVGLIVLTARMVPPAGRPFVIVILAANPLVLIHLVAGAHLDAVAAALLVSALALTRGERIHDPHRRWLAIMLCTLGAMVKLPVALGVVYVTIAALVAAGPTIAARVRNLAGNVLAAALGLGLSVLLSGTGFGWIHNFGTPGRLRTGIAPADILAQIVRGGGWLVGVHLGSGSVLTGARAAALGIGVGLSVWLLCPRRAADGSMGPPTLDRLGLALLAMALLGPVLYGWYLAPALPLLAIAASRRHAADGARQPQPKAAKSTASSGLIPARAAEWTVIALSTLLTLATVPSLVPAWRVLGNHPNAAGAGGASVVAVIAALLIAVRIRAVRHPERPPTASTR